MKRTLHALFFLVGAASFATGCGDCGKTSTGTSGADAGGDAKAAVAPVPDLPALAPSVVAQRLNPRGLPVYQGPTAKLEGRVFVRGPAAPQLPRPEFTTCKIPPEEDRLFREGPADAEGRRPLADAVVGVTGYDDLYVPAKGDAVGVRIKDCRFDRRTVVLTLGQRLDVFNDDAVNSESFYALNLSRNRTPALTVAAPKADPAKFSIREPGRDRLFDNMGHAELSADVYVAMSALNAVTDVNGHFVIEGIPVGEWKASALHPQLDGQQASKTLVFREGEVTHADFELTWVGTADESKPVGDAGASRDAGTGKDAGAADAGSNVFLRRN